MLDRKGRAANRSLILLILIGVVILATGVYAFLQLRVDQLSEALKKNSRSPRCSSFRTATRRSSSRFSSIIRTPARAASSTSRPTSGGSSGPIDKVAGIDALYHRANPGPLVKRLQDLLGSPIQSIVDIGLDQAGKLVDLMGGMDVFIPNPVDLTQGDRRILLPSGSVTLDGAKARDYITYEDPLESESDRVGRRQKFLQALLKALGESNSFLLERGPFRVLRSLLKTSLPPRALSAFVTEMGRFDSERIVLQRVLGTTRTVDGRDLLFPHQDGDLVREAVKQSLAANASNEFVAPADLTITVEVLNGTKVAGLAARARELLQSFDLDVMAANNADNDQYQNTVVLDRKGKLDDARKVADILHCTRVVSQPDPQMDQSVDVTVILGRDFDGRTVQ